MPTTIPTMQPGTHVLGIDVGKNNLALCLVKPGSTIGEDEIVEWALLSLEHATPKALVKSVEAGEVVSWLEGKDVRVVIERQPPKNPSMKKLEHYLEMFFTMKGLVTSTIDPKHKLSFAARTPWWPKRDIPSWTYVQRKKLSVETTTEALKTIKIREELSKLFKSSKKKDDFADAFLHAMAFSHAA